MLTETTGTRAAAATLRDDAPALLDVLGALHVTLRDAWDRRELPASVVPGDLARSVEALLRKHGRM